MNNNPISDIHNTIKTFGNPVLFKSDNYSQPSYAIICPMTANTHTHKPEHTPLGFAGNRRYRLIAIPTPETIREFDTVTIQNHSFVCKNVTLRSFASSDIFIDAVIERLGDPQ